MLVLETLTSRAGCTTRDGASPTGRKEVSGAFTARPLPPALKESGVVLDGSEGICLREAQG